MIYSVTLITGLICAIFSIRAAQDKLYENTIETALNEQFRIGYTIKRMAENQHYNAEEARLYLLGTVRSLANNYFEYYSADAAFRITYDDDWTIFANIPDEHIPLLQLDPAENGAVSYFIERHNGKILMVISSYINIYSTMLRLDYVRDVTSTQERLSSLSVNIAVTLFLAQIFLFAMINLVIKNGFRPLDTLRKHAIHITTGDYGKRIEVVRDDEVGQLAFAFNQMSGAVSDSFGELKKLVRSKELLISNLAHEVKTPVTSIVAYSDYAVQKDIGKEELFNILEYIRKEGQRISVFSDKILNWSRINQLGEAETKPCRPERIIEQALYTLEPIVNEKNQKIETDIQVDVIYADGDLLVSLIINLLKNASNASDEFNSIWLNIFINEYNVLNIIAIDNGVGIEAHELDKITEPLYMVDKSRERSKKGAGIGLSLCQAIVEAHKGTMAIDSVFGQGTVVTVKIPQ
jgi:signal transduction histidine kinase